MRNEVKIQETIDLLNEDLKLDPGAVQDLFGRRVFCNGKLADHPSIQVQAVADGRLFMVGILGLINGLFGVDHNGKGPIVMVVDRDDRILKFDRYSDPVVNSE